MPEIIVTIKPDGTTEISVTGQVGPGCVDLTRAIEEALGDAESRSCTVDYYQEAQTEEELKQWGS